MKIILRLFTLICMWAAATSSSSAQSAIMSGIFHETGVTFDGAWHDTGIVGNAMTITVYEDYMYYGNDYAVRRGNANVYGFSGRRYNLINKNGEEVTTYYFIYAQNEVIRVWEVEYNFGTVPVLGMSVTQKTVTAYITAHGYPQSSGNGGNYNNNNNYSQPQQQQNQTQTKSNYGMKTCSDCHGSGKCRWCYGSGWWEAKRDGVLCPNCDKNHNGVCSKCHGTGKVYGNLTMP